MVINVIEFEIYISKIPLQQVYNINLGNPGQGHSQLNSIYEDILPADRHHCHNV